MIMNKSDIMRSGEILKICLAGLAGILIGSFAYDYFSNETNENEGDFNDDYVDEEEEDEEEEEIPVTDEFLAKLKANTNTDKALGAIFIIRKDLKMGKGKILAQCGHATLGIFLKVAQKFNYLGINWKQGFPKKYFYCNDEKEMDECVAKAKELGFFTVKIHDAGRTQIAAGSATVVSIGPIPMERAAEICGKLAPAK